MAKFIVGAALALLLAGCGGGEDAPAPAAPPVPPPSAPTAPTCTPKVVSIATIGDSTMWGYGGSMQARLQAEMDARFGAGATTTQQYAVSGTMAVAAPLGVVADIIVTNYGINDMRNSEPIATYKAAMLAIHPTLIMTQNPIADRSYNEQAYVDAAESLGVPIADVHTFVLSQPDWQSLLADGIHPADPLSAWIIGQVLAPEVAKQVAPLRCLAG